MNKEEFITTLELKGFVVGYKKKIPHELVVGIPSKEKGKFLPLYSATQDFIDHASDLQSAYDYIIALLDKARKDVEAKMNKEWEKLCLLRKVEA